MKNTTEPKSTSGRLATGWESLTTKRWFMPGLLVIGFFLSLAIPSFKLLDPYIQLIFMYIGINIILTVSLNLINGYMGEFSVGHAGFMSVGAYIGALLSTKVFPTDMIAYLFPLTVFLAGLGAAFIGLIVALPSFKTRGDYLAIVTLAFLMIVKSVIENIDAIGGPRGIPGIYRLTTMPWVYIWTVLAMWVIRNFIYSRFGRGVLSIREDEIASDLMSVNTNQVKLMAFVLSSFFAGVAGALFAHLLQFISPRVFDIVKSTDILIMVYLGGIGSLGGSVLGATIYTVLLEVLRPLREWRFVLMPLVLVLLMIYRPRGIMGLREFRWLIPQRDVQAVQNWKPKESADVAAG